jgi:hypothetical protein
MMNDQHNYGLSAEYLKARKAWLISLSVFLVVELLSCCSLILLAWTYVAWWIFWITQFVCIVLMFVSVFFRMRMRSLLVNQLMRNSAHHHSSPQVIYVQAPPPNQPGYQQQPVYAGYNSYAAQPPPPVNPTYAPAPAGTVNLTKVV